MNDFSIGESVKYDYESNRVELDLKFTKTDILDLLEAHLEQYRGKKLALFLSGGYDSQFIFLLLRHFGIPFDVFTYKFKWGHSAINSQDLIAVDEFLEYIGDTKKINLQFNAGRFLGSDRLREVCMEYNTSSPQVALHLAALEDFSKGYDALVLGGETPTIVRSGIAPYTTSCKVNPQYFINIASPYVRLAEKHNVGLIKDILYATPEILFQAFMQNIKVAEQSKVYFNPSIPHKLSGTRYKLHYYNSFGLEQELLPVLSKSTGFELLKRHLAITTGVYDEFDHRYRYPMEIMLKTNQLQHHKPAKTSTTTKSMFDTIQGQMNKAIKTSGAEGIAEYSLDF